MFPKQLKTATTILLSGAVTLLGVSILLFYLRQLIPIDPVLSVVGDQASHATYLRVKAEMGLDLPLYQQWLAYLKNVFHGDFGKSFMTNTPVFDDLKRVFPATLELATLSLILGTIPGIFLGVVTAFRQNRLLDKTLNFVILIGYSVPVFWLALMALFVFYFHLGWVPASGRLSVFYESFPLKTGFIFYDAFMAHRVDILKDALHHIALPATLLAFLVFCYITRMTRTYMVEQLQQAYILTAKAKGLSPRHIATHALYNIRAPLITIIALCYGALLEGTVLTETIFSWPGMGLYITQALKSMDLNAILGSLLWATFLYIVINLSSDVLGRYLDVRIRR